MGLDPDETQLAVYRAAIQTFDRNMVQQEYYDSLRESGMLSGMRADTAGQRAGNLTVLLKTKIPSPLLPDTTLPPAAAGGRWRWSFR